ncbi:glycosyltransferase family 2 protein [Alkalilacustris brevis]|uniref:glycosyltransferase family 2 protein n=1 Tax=Alkalilacustris brevis TaxID=2026338 RepID=UPI00138FF4D3|nr:glycosyltransferase family 2 protein [Alkalilacustris brevis]
MAENPTPESTPQGPRHVLVATMKNEGPFILEWVAYHRLIGFDEIIIFANDCTDGSDRLLAALDAAGLIRYFDNTPTPEGLPADPQNRAYRRAFEMEAVRNAEWIMVLDADEFFNIHAGRGHLDDLFAALPDDADAFGPTWRIFGNGGITRFEDAPVITRFTRAAPRELPVSFNHYGLKTMFRPGPVHRLGIHRPHFKGHYKRPDTPLKWLNGSGEDVTEHFRVRGWSASAATVGYDLAEVNHYMIKSSEVFLMKRWRGTANSSDPDRINFDYFDQFNSNHEAESSITRWAGPLSQRIAEIRATHPEVAARHDACVTFFNDRIATLRTTLEKADPEAAARLFDTARQGDTIAAQENWLAGKRAARPPQPEPKPAQTPDTEGTGEDTDITESAAPAEQPQWLADLRQSPFRRGFYHSDEKFAAVFARRSDAQLVISFDNLSSVRDPSLARGPWGYEFIRKLGHSHLGIMSFEANWFRDPALFAYLEKLRDDGFFAGFGRVALMGTSMGAYAAAAFAALAPGATVIALSPQSTLDSRLVPWERRFRSGQKQDWTGPYADAPQQVTTAERVYLFHDPRFAPDRRHAQRFSGPNISFMHTRHSGHKSALFLRRAGILSRVVEQAIAGTLTPAAFYTLYREGRSLPWYLNSLTEKVMEHGRPDLVMRALRHIETQGRAPMAASIARRLDLAV